MTSVPATLTAERSMNIKISPRKYIAFRLVMCYKHHKCTIQKKITTCPEL